jgi:hypothetical protein
MAGNSLMAAGFKQVTYGAEVIIVVYKYRVAERQVFIDGKCA